MVPPSTPVFGALEHFMIDDTRPTVSLILFSNSGGPAASWARKGLVRESASAWLFLSVASLGTKVLVGHCNMSGGKWLGLHVLRQSCKKPKGHAGNETTSGSWEPWAGETGWRGGQ